MTTVLILLAFGVAFMVFALLGVAERDRACLEERIGDPKCERCPLGSTGNGALTEARSWSDGK